MKTTTVSRLSLDDYLKLQYRFDVIADPDGGWVIDFPDLPGCTTQADTPDEIVPMAEEGRQLWIESMYERGLEIPLPSYPEEYSGKFNLRLPKSLHRKLAESAERDGVSLNQYAVMLLSRGDAQRTIRSSLEAIEHQLSTWAQQMTDTRAATENADKRPTVQYDDEGRPRSKDEPYLRLVETRAA